MKKYIKYLIFLIFIILILFIYNIIINEKTVDIELTDMNNTYKMNVDNYALILNNMYYDGKVKEDNDIDIIANDNFDMYMIGDNPIGMMISSKSNKIYIDKHQDTGNKSLKFEKLSIDDMYAGTSMNIPEIPSITCDFKVLFEDINALCTITYRGSQTSILNAIGFTKEGKVLNVNGQSIMDYETNRWYRVTVIVNIVDKYCTVYIDGKLIDNKIKFNNEEFNDVKLIRFQPQAGEPTHAIQYIDDWRVYTGEVIPSDDYFDSKCVITNSPFIDQNKMAYLFRDATVFMVNSCKMFSGGKRLDIEKDNKKNNVLIYNDIIMVPSYVISSAMAVDAIEDKSENGKVILSQNGIIYEYQNAKLLGMDDVLYVPIKECAEAFGYSVYINDNGLISMEKNSYKINYSSNINLVKEMERYLKFYRPSQQDVIEMFNKNKPMLKHPYLIANQNTFDDIKNLLSTDINMINWFKELIIAGDLLLGKEIVEYVLSDRQNLLSTSRDMLNKSKTLGLLYNLTDDEKYIDCLWENLQSAGTFPDWNPNHFLDVAEMTTAFAIAYDWLYDSWTDEQRYFLEKCIQEKGLAVAIDYYVNLNINGHWVVGENNWNVVCNSGMIIGALAIGEVNPEMMGAIVSSGLWGIETVMKEFDPDGAWSEGPEYWEYTVQYYSMMIASLDSSIGTDFAYTNVEGLKTSCESIIYATSSQGIFNIHDVSDGVDYINSPEFFWFAKKYNKPELGKMRLEMMKSYSFECDPFDLLWYNQEFASEMEFKFPFDAYFRKIETAYFHDIENGNNIAFAALHGGDNGVNHGHLDVGQFVYDALGERWFVDLGKDNYNLSGYFSTNRWNYYRLRAEGHNTIVINPSETPDQLLKSISQILSFNSNDNLGYAIVDMTSAYSVNAIKTIRGLLFNRIDDSIILRDEFILKKPSELYWFAHTDGIISLCNSKKEAIVTKNGKSIYVKLDTDIEEAEFSIMSAKPLYTSLEYDNQNENLEYKKLTIHMTNVKTGYINVIIVPMEVSLNQSDYSGDLFKNLKLLTKEMNDLNIGNNEK